MGDPIDMNKANGLLIKGRAVPGGAEPLRPVNPATGRPGTSYEAATGDDVTAACDAAHAAHMDGTWRFTPAHEKAILLRRVATAIREERDQLARVQMTQNGKSITECRGQATKAAEVFDYYASVVESQTGEVTPPRGAYLSFTEYEPFGVVALITPWNSPLTLDAQKLAPALAAGNCIVHKPSEVTPGAGLALGWFFQQAGLPEGMINVVNGRGAEMGDALVGNPQVRMVSFTGGTATGRRIAQAAGARLVPVSLELGGKSPQIVFADADLDAAAEGVVPGIFGSMGQSCVAGSRLLVEARVQDEFVRKLVEHAGKFRIGRPEDETTQLGPMATFQQREQAEAFIAGAVEDSARLATGGTRPDAPELADGAHLVPAVLDNVSRDARVWREEVFGPVLAISAFEDERDLIDAANGTDFGLAAGIWTSDFPKAYRVARRVEAGSVWINCYKILSISSPFGGAKDSGIGREKGQQGLRLYQEAKSLYVGL